MSKESLNLNGTSRVFLEEFAELKADVRVLAATHEIEIRDVKHEVSSIKSILKMLFGAMVTLVATIVTVLGATALT